MGRGESAIDSSGDDDEGKANWWEKSLRRESGDDKNLEAIVALWLFLFLKTLISSSKDDD